MENCLVKQLKVQVNDDTFPYLDKIVIPYSSLKKNMLLTVKSLSLNTEILKEIPKVLGVRFYNKFIAANIGDKFTFEGIENVYGANEVNVRIIAFDNVYNFKTVEEYFNSENNVYLLDISLYNHDNFSKRTFEIPNTQELQNAQNLCIGIGFIVKNFDGNINEENITIQYKL